jgi:hypothetical protein
MLNKSLNKTDVNNLNLKYASKERLDVTVSIAATYPGDILTKDFGEFHKLFQALSVILL